MNKLITIEKMNMAEKIKLMEELWTDLSASPDYTPPEWHENELARRKLAVSEGKVTYTDWSQAKDEIRKDVS